MPWSTQENQFDPLEETSTDQLPPHMHRSWPLSKLTLNLKPATVSVMSPPILFNMLSDKMQSGFSLGGFTSPDQTPLPVGAASKPLLTPEIARAHILVKDVGIPIVGIAGPVIVIANKMGLETVCLLSRTEELGPDSVAAETLLESPEVLIKSRFNLVTLDRETEKVWRLRMKTGETTVMYY